MNEDLPEHLALRRMDAFINSVINLRDAIKDMPKEYQYVTLNCCGMTLDAMMNEFLNRPGITLEEVAKICKLYR